MTSCAKNWGRSGPPSMGPAGREFFVVRPDRILFLAVHHHFINRSIFLIKVVNHRNTLHNSIKYNRQRSDIAFAQRAGQYHR